MPTGQSGSACRLMAAALAVSTLPLALAPRVLAQAAGTGVGAAAVSGGAAVDRADSLIAAGRPVTADRVLRDLLRSDELLALSAADRERVLSLMRRVERRLEIADPIEVSLEQSELALTDGDLRLAERHARAVLDVTRAAKAQSGRARTVIAEVEKRRREIEPMIPEAISQAVADFAAGRFADAKAWLDAVSRSGVTLTDGQQRTVEGYQLRLFDLERERDAPFDMAQANIAAGVLQPGTVRRSGGQPNGNQPTEPAEPAAEPQPETPAEAPAEPAAAQPEPPAQPAPPPVQQDDLIQAAMRTDSQRILAEADLAFQEGRYNESREKYSLAVNARSQYLTAEQLRHAQDRLTETQLRLQSVAPQPIETDVTEAIRLRRQRAEAQFENEMQQARAALAAGDSETARGMAARAELTVNQSRSVFNETELESFASRVRELRRQIETTSDQMRETERQRTEADLARAARDQERLRTREKDRRISEALDRIAALQSEMKYREALQVVDQLLFIDPINPSGLLLKKIITDVIIYQAYNEIEDLKQVNHADMTIENSRAMIPPGGKGLMEFPPDWPKKTFDRGELSAYAETPENRRTLAKIDSQRIPAAFNDNTLADVINFLETITQLDIDTDWDSLTQIGVDRESLVTLNVSSAPVRVVLDRVLEKVSNDPFVRAGWAVNDGILTIASDDDLRKNTNLVIYNIQDLIFDIPDFTDAPQIDLQSLLQQSQGGGGGGGQTPFNDAQNDQNRTPEQVEMERQERITDIIGIIQENVDYEGWRDTGGDTGAIQELNGSLIITNTPKNHREIVGLLSKLREIRAMQINVETKFLLVNQDWFEQIGFDIDLVLNADNNQFRSARGFNNALQPVDFFDFSAAPRGLQRTVGGAIDLNGDGDTTDPGETSGALNVVNPTSFSPIGVGQNSLGLAGLLAQGDFAGTVLGASPALGISGQFLDDIQVDFLIQATQADRRTVQLTAPRLTFTNGQTSNIFVVTQQAFVSDLEPVVGDSAVGFDPDVAVASEGVTMLVEGVVTADRRYVTMTIDAGVGRIDGFAEQGVTAIAGGELVDSADTQSFIQLPTVTVTRVRTTVTVPDEGTVLLGGQRLVTELEVETGVPVLSKLPILNRFFTNRIESKEEQTLLILVKPTILIQSEEEERAHPGLLDAVRTGVGLP